MRKMMARISDRILKELKADLIENRARYDATIENFSENGIKVITDTAVDILPDETIDLEFEIPSGEVLSLHCKVIWSSKISSESLLKDIGLEITENSLEYEDFFKTLYMDDNLYL
jgi:NADH dehydrogenase FAD-containing subunit